MDIAAGQVRVGVATGNFPGTPAAMEEIEVSLRQHTAKSTRRSVIGPAFAGKEPARGSVNTVKPRVLSIVLMHPGMQVLALHREWTLHPSGLGSHHQRAVGV